ncbi:MAG: helix-turn-helix domain-containing protein [Oscillospiraceae bacterium]|nr:helix-turn-helix domain-containing protein [Oscillospiraceae bacterium]
MENKTEIMAQIVALLSQLIDENTAPTAESKSSAPVKMLTIKECTKAVSGLSEHTVRQLVVQKKIPFIRTGQGKRGKILISKAALLEYLGGDAS